MPLHDARALDRRLLFMLRTWRRHLWTRAGILAGVASLTAGMRCSAAPTVPADLPGLARLLSDASQVQVAPAEIGWEPAGNLAAEAVWGRPLLFLGAGSDGMRDLYRAWVRISGEGKPIAVARIRNLTRTRYGDEVGLLVAGPWAAFATLAYGRVQSVTVLDTAGIDERDATSSWSDRMLRGLSSLQETGNVFGLGRSDIVFDVPPPSAQLRFDGENLQVALEDARRDLVYDPRSRIGRGTAGELPQGVHVVQERHRHKPILLWGVDTIREELGPAPIALVQKVFFGARDLIKRGVYAVIGTRGPTTTLKQADAAQSSAQIPTAVWPPEPIPSIWQEPRSGEGQWKPVTLGWTKQIPVGPGEEAPPAYFYETFIRPDELRPYVELHLIAMDMRQLNLHMQAGYDDPRPLTGLAGSGRLPEDPELVSRVVATFNGAFKTTHGAYGMMVDRHVLLPPEPRSATIIVDDQGRAGFGNWPRSTDIPDDLVSFRQNLDPLVEDGRVNPTGRHVWGWQLAGDSVLTDRSALCITPSRQLLYAWGKELTGKTLAVALRQAGCDYAVHLDMNPKHCGFVYTDISGSAPEQMRLLSAHPGMTVPPNRYVSWSPKDFFFLTLRPRIEKIPELELQPVATRQPTPTWLPGVLEGEVQLGTLSVSVLSVEARRAEFALRGGELEPVQKDAAPRELELVGADFDRALLAINLGHTTNATRYGLAFGGKESLALRRPYASLVIAKDGELRVESPGTDLQLSPGEAAVQLPTLADAGRVDPGAEGRGESRARGALCVLGGRLLIASVEHDSSGPLASALLNVGCKTVLELDRGSHHAHFIHPAGTTQPPLPRYETTVLYALDHPMTPAAYRWRPRGSEPASSPSGYDRGGAPTPATGIVGTQE